MDKFIQNLNYLLEQKGISRNKLSKEVGIGESTIRSWYKGTIPTIDKVIKLSQYFAIPLNELLGIENDYTDDEKRLIEYYRTLDKSSQNAMLTLFNIKQQDEGKSLISKIG